MFREPATPQSYGVRYPPEKGSFGSTAANLRPLGRHIARRNHGRAHDLAGHTLLRVLVLGTISH